MDIKPLKIGDLVAKIPVIQGGMGVGISLSGLAGAVALEGGVGIISTAQIGFRSPDFDKNPIAANLKAIGEEIKKAREIAKDGIIGVNIMVATKDYEEYVKTAVKAGVDLIISGAGLPISLPKLIEGSKTKIAPIVSSLKSADVICKLWDRKYQRTPDLVVIEGARAGGHLGFSVEELERFDQKEYDGEIKKIIALVNQYGEKYEKEIPVVVAGGVYDRADLDYYVSLGASGVQIASRFVATHECDADPKYKEAYLNAKEEDIVIVKSPVGMPGRAINNAFLERLKGGPIKVEVCRKCLSACNPATIPYCITQALINAAKGDVDNGLLFCGSNAWRIQELVSVSDILEEFK
ncbi:NAD(P)H-dependent flavin oxidoreductase [Konateibacter massiliensis]|uniref:NAD(P)H-dependent flavin oxidoreductase n=1 Tax=Konateibacter massiliensis TaxID=2002841 RepID=UPI000C148916|nr:nitronate monooxygenase family protein [Konateibacter massiliensis]